MSTTIESPRARSRNRNSARNRSLSRRKPNANYRHYNDVESSLNLQQALERARNRRVLENGKEESLRDIAREFKIPPTTLCRKYREEEAHPPGRRPALTAEDEAVFAKLFAWLADAGRPLTQSEARQVIGKSQLCNGVRRAFKGNRSTHDMPGPVYFDGFLSRNGSLSLRKPEPLSLARAKAVSPESLHTFFDLYEPHVDKLKIRDCPRQLFNLDEKSLPAAPKSARVLARRGAQTVSKIQPGNDRLHYTLLACGNAAGSILPPYLVYKGSELALEHVKDGPPGARYNTTKSGWVDDIVFEDFIRNVFIPEVKILCPNLPVLLLYDGHYSHLTIDVIELCVANCIDVRCLPAHTTHVLQPMDVGVFGPLGKKWNSVLEEFLSESPFANEDECTNVCREAMPTLLRRLWERMDFLTALTGGFRGSGLYPVDRNVVITKAHQLIVHPPLSENTGIEKSNEMIAVELDAIDDPLCSPIGMQACSTPMASSGSGSDSSFALSLSSVQSRSNAITSSVLHVLQAKQCNSITRAPNVSYVNRLSGQSLTEESARELLLQAKQQKEAKKRAQEERKEAKKRAREEQKQAKKHAREEQKQAKKHAREEQKEAMKHARAVTLSRNRKTKQIPTVAATAAAVIDENCNREMFEQWRCAAQGCSILRNANESREWFGCEGPGCGRSFCERCVDVKWFCDERYFCEHCRASIEAMEIPREDY